MIAALFVHKNGPYFGHADIDPWDEARDARNYPGPHAVIAHPPCSRWCRLAGLVEARWGYKKGEDDGCFASALDSVRRWGGVLEHPAYSDAFDQFGLSVPPYHGWQQTLCGGWVCYVEQGRYGHPAKKATWLYAHGATFLPSLDWGHQPDNSSRALVSWCANHTKREYVTITHGETRVGTKQLRQRVGKKAAAETPPAFRDILISIARSASAKAVEPK
jgi:hypothetical protein